ncbi:MAG: 4Fe-4S dicluster domain-containing protein, partial [Candidatus Bathyarchaeia archaeon]
MDEAKTVVEPDPTFSRRIIDLGGEGLYRCFQCATCSGSCPPGRVSPFRIRRLIRQAQLGLRGELLPTPDPWMCTQCFRCYERCPRDVKILELVLALRRWMVEKEAAPGGINTLSKTIVDTLNPLAMKHDARVDWIEFRKRWNRRLIDRMGDEERRRLRYVELGKEDLIRERAETVYFVGCNSSYPRMNMG